MITFGSAKGVRYGMREEKLYNHKLGWRVLRAKDDYLAQALAENMRKCCCNKNLKYNQTRRLEIIARGINAIVTTCGDCSSTVRACIMRQGYNIPNFTTATEYNTLMGTGLFFEVPYDVNTLHNGDILVTKSKGHTGIITCGAIIPGTVENKVVALPTLKKGSKGRQVEILQINLNKVANAGLVCDGDFGKKTQHAVKTWQACAGLVSDGIYGVKSFNKMKEIIEG